MTESNQTNLACVNRPIQIIPSVLPADWANMGACVKELEEAGVDRIQFDVMDLDAAVEDNIKSIAEAKKVKISEVTACVLERPRHDDIIESLRTIGSKIVLIPDGDVAGVIMTTQEHNPVDIYLGIGGAPEGVLAAAALQCIGGQMQTRLVINNDDEKNRAEKIGI